MKLSGSGLFCLLPAMLLCHTLVAQESGVTATTFLKTDRSWDEEPLRYPEGSPEVSGLIIEIAPGAVTGWHRHPVPSFALIIEGELEVELKDGRRLLLQAGDGLAETVNVWHNGRNVGSLPVKLAVFYAGVKEQPLTQVEPTAVE
jgi:quercetin dioxygenase-like cupin family protein